MIVVWILVGFALALAVGGFILALDKNPSPEDAEEIRKQAAAKLLRDLLMLSDIDGTVSISKDHRRRIETWLVGGDERYHELWMRSGGRYATSLGEYRDVAKLINEMVHPTDLDGEITMLPSTIQVRAQSWLNGHRKALTAS